MSDLSPADLLAAGRFDELVWDGGEGAATAPDRLLARAAAAQRLGLWDAARESAAAWAAQGAHVSEGPLVSIVVPTFNRRDSLRRALASVAAQLYRPIEIVVVNDAGEPVGDVLDEFRGQVPIVEVVHEENRYLAASRNSGAARASGVYVGFLDDDDELYPHHVGHLVALLAGGPERAARAVPHLRRDGGLRRYPARSFAWSELLLENVVPVQAVLMERALVAEAGGFDESLRVNEDWEFWLRMRERTAVAESPVVTSCVDVRTTRERMSSRSRAPFLAAHAAIYERTRAVAERRCGADLAAARRAFLDDLERQVHDEIRATRRIAVVAWGEGADALPVPTLDVDDPAAHAAALNALFADRDVDFVAVVRADLLRGLDARWTLRLGAQLLADPRRAAAGPLDDGDGGLAYPEGQGEDVAALDPGCALLRTAPWRDAASASDAASARGAERASDAASARGAAPWRADVPPPEQWERFFAGCRERGLALRRTFDRLFADAPHDAGRALAEIVAPPPPPPFAPTVVLGWHRVPLRPGADPFRLAIAQDAFEAQVRALAERFRIIHPDELGRPAPDGDPRTRVLLTFDDGYRDNYDCAFPVLAKLGLPAVLFLSTGYVEGELPFWWEALARAGDGVPEGEQQEWRFLPPEERAERVRALALAPETTAELRGLAATWPMIEELHRSGLVEIGAHTRFHSSLGRLDDAALEAEIAGARDDIARRLGAAPRLFAYPHGAADDVSATAVGSLRRLGFEFAVTTSPGALRAAARPGALESLVLPRLVVGTRTPEELVALVEELAAPPARPAAPDDEPRRKIAVLSGISAHNIGDDAMLVATVQDLRRLDPRADVRVLAESPETCGPVAAQIDAPILPSLQRFVRSFVAGLPAGADANLALLQTARDLLGNREAILAGARPAPLGPAECEGLRWLMGADGVADCGGANLTPHWKSFFHEKCLDYLVAAHPLAVFGQGIDRFEDAGDRALLAAALGRAAQVTLREGISADYLREVGCRAPLATTGDDALTIAAAPPAEVCRLLARAGLDPSRSYLAFQFRHYLDYAAEETLDLFAALVRAAIETTGLPVLGVPMHFAETDEREHLAAVKARLPETAPFAVYPDELTPAQAKGLFGGARAAFGISYHSAILTLGAGTPYLGLYRGTHYTQKMRGLAALYDLPDLALPLEGLAPETFAAALRDRLARRGEICAHLAARHAELSRAVRASRAAFVEAVRRGAEERRVPAAARPRTPGPVDWGNLRHFEPVSDKWGFDRGLPVDRVYIEEFLERNAEFVRGDVCELLNDDYTVRFGGRRVARREILDIDAGNKQATILDDLTCPERLGTERFDCFILTQTLSYIYDCGAALRHAYASLKPGGTLLVTVPSTIRFHREPEDHWRFTADSLARLIAERCPGAAYEVEQKGNLVVAIAFLLGLAREDLEPAELRRDDERFPIVVLARITRPASS